MKVTFTTESWTEFKKGLPGFEFVGSDIHVLYCFIIFTKSNRSSSLKFNICQLLIWQVALQNY